MNFKYCSISQFCDHVGHDPTRDRLESIDWNQLLEQQGYVSVELDYQSDITLLQAYHWCCEQFGKEHFTWTGSRHWFESEQNAALFMLRWS